MLSLTLFYVKKRCFKQKRDVDYLLNEDTVAIRKLSAFEFLTLNA